MKNARDLHKVMELAQCILSCLYSTTNSTALEATMLLFVFAGGRANCPATTPTTSRELPPLAPPLHHFGHSC